MHSVSMKNLGQAQGNTPLQLKTTPTNKTICSHFLSEERLLKLMKLYPTLYKGHLRRQDICHQDCKNKMTAITITSLHNGVEINKQHTRIILSNICRSYQEK